MVECGSVTVDGVEPRAAANVAGPPRLLLLRGTFWSRGWEPILPAFGDVVAAAALDFPGFGRSGGESTGDGASVPRFGFLDLIAVRPET